MLTQGKIRRPAWARWDGGIVTDILPSVFAAILLVGTVTYHLRTRLPAAVVTTPIAAKVHASSRTVTFDPAILQHWHPFGTRAQAGNAATARTTRETTLSLTLKGVYFSDQDKDTGYAIIDQPGSGEHSYSVGDALPGSAVLYRVEKRRVILKHGGRLETLSLPRQDMADDNDAATAGNARTPDGQAVEISARTR